MRIGREGKKQTQEGFNRTEKKWNGSICLSRNRKVKARKLYEEESII
jgi:predicted negative regulator of RcsB-dependent stress response